MLNTKHKRQLVLMSVDLLILMVVYLSAFCVSLIVNAIETTDFVTYVLSFAIIAVCILTLRICGRVYTNVWRYANSRAYLEMIVVDAIGGLIGVLITHAFAEYTYIGLWESTAIVAIFCCGSLMSRFVYQQTRKHNNKKIGTDEEDNKITVAIVGAGQVGSLLADELLYYKQSHYRPVCFIDNNIEKIGNRMSGLPIISESEDIFDKLKKMHVQEIFIAIPRLTGDEIKEVIDYYSQSGMKVKIYDFPCSDEDYPNVDTDKRVIREFKIEDLLFRRSKELMDFSTKAFYENKVVLITGGGGSIGSELARKVATCNPKQLIIFDIYENNAYDIQQELIRRYGDKLNLAVEIGSVRERARLEAVFANYHPDIVFHAAAHKHVPLMEHSNAESIKNNVLGTYNTADMAEKYGVKKFILISTDKAVNPTNVMGASKRLCEMVLLCRHDSNTVFSAVRFGNVLGSNGSVIPLFKKQIAAGGPVTITDKRIIRYFMTIPEASELVMQAGSMAKGGQLFVLDMGKPVKIYDLAENMIKLSGLKPHEDIPIVETGLRPGEKLYEELLIKTENLDKTDNDLIFIEQDTPLSRSEVEEKLNYLRTVVEQEEGKIASPVITEAMKQVVPTFHSPEEVNKNAQDSDEMKEVLAGKK